MSSYDLAVEAIQEGHIHANLSGMVDYFEQLNIDEQNEFTC